MKDRNEENSKSILVLGGNGKTGSRVARQLTSLGLSILIGGRSSNPTFDWENPATWPAVLQNISSAYITFQPDLAIPGAVETIKSFAEMAVKCGVKRLVLLSGRGEDEALQCEEAIISAGVDWTIVRASWFCQNFSEGYMLDPILAGHVALPVGNVGEPFIDIDDIADVVVAALTQDHHVGQIYEVTGPRLLTFKDAVEEISRATGKAIQFEQIPMSVYAETLSQYDVPPEVIALLSYLFTEVLDGRNASLADGVQRALGRMPTDFTEYVRKTVGLGVWATSPASPASQTAPASHTSPAAYGRSLSNGEG